MDDIDKKKTDEKKKISEPDSSKEFLIIFSIVMVVCIVGFGIILINEISKNSNKTSTESANQISWANKNNSEDAFYISREMVADMLLSQSTADFPTYNKSIANVEKVKGTTMYVVGSYVDAENAYGVKIRKYYMMTVEQTGPTKWKMVEFEWK